MTSFDDIFDAMKFPSIKDPTYQDIQARLYKMIDYAKDRFHWYEDQRERKLSLALALGAVSSISFTLLIGKSLSDAPTTRVFVAITLLSIVSTSMLVIGVYLRGQNRVYTHRHGLATINSWYNYPVSKNNGFAKDGSLFSTIVGIDESPFYVRGDQDVAHRAELLGTKFEEFCTNSQTIFRSSKNSIREDLQQVYILYIFQTIARENLQLMVRVLQYGGLIIGLASFASIVVATLGI
jgi:hypothetical protein